MKRKSALLIMLLFFVTTLFTGCGETENQPTDSQTNSTGSNAPENQQENQENRKQIPPFILIL